MPHTNRIPPAKTEIAELEPFEGLPMDRIFVIRTQEEADAALADLIKAGEVGFDTESKPTFRKGEKSDGPHVFQFATTERAYIFQSYVSDCHPAIMALLEAPELKKIGFGLRGDLGHIWTRFGIRPAGIHDLDRSFKNSGFRNAVGARSAIAMIFQRRLAKSKSVTTSNWANTRLSEAQLIYAANDAYAAIRVFHALDRLEPPAG